MKTLIGIDFSRAGVAAGDWTSRWFVPEAPLALLYSVQVPTGPSFTSVHDEGHDEILGRAREAARRALVPLAQEWGPDRTRVVVGGGAPDVALLDEAGRWGARVVAIGPHGHSPFDVGILGSTAARLLRNSRLPVLVVRGERPKKPERMLVAVDDGDLTTEVLEWARAVHDLHGTDVIGLYVYETLLEGLPVFSGPSGDVDLAVGLEDAAARWLAERMQDAGIPEDQTDLSVRRGHAGEEICAEAKARNADLIVMGTHGRPLAGPTIGSVARYVVGHAPCPVLVIPETDEA